jgi:hypothetical protein
MMLSERPSNAQIRVALHSRGKLLSDDKGPRLRLLLQRVDPYRMLQLSDKPRSISRAAEHYAFTCVEQINWACYLMCPRIGIIVGDARICELAK